MLRKADKSIIIIINNAELYSTATRGSTGIPSVQEDPYVGVYYITSYVRGWLGMFACLPIGVRCNPLALTT